MGKFIKVDTWTGLSAYLVKEIFFEICLSDVLGIWYKFKLWRYVRDFC